VITYVWNRGSKEIGVTAGNCTHQNPKKRANQTGYRNKEK